MTTGWILLVDDEPSILHVLAEVLRDEGYDVASCSGGALALEAIGAASAAPDLIVLDMRMPGMDGWQFAAELRSRKIASPVLVMTAGSQARQAAHEIGAAGYIGKPFDIEQFIGSVASITAGSGH
jgi:putative two-component system response regulator